MVILYLVAPIMAPFDISLETLKIFLTYWANYRTSVNLTVYPSCKLIFTVTYISHFIFFPFTTITSILHYSMFSCFSSCMWYAMMHWCLPNILLGILPCHSLELLHIIQPLQICCQHHILSLSSFTNNQPPCGPFFHSCYILCWIKVFCYSCFCFLYFHFPINMTFCGHTCHTCCMWPWRTCFCVFSFLQILVIEIYLCYLASIVYFLFLPLPNYVF